ncbi:MAG: DUF6508 domain-containing protein [Bacillota bacterium]|nr:DUF6508 domain-containing protein [Bacillota bacterium]MDW7682699.1 DUF6508 domain-containing protein [Bacillota bacterium]
MKRESIDRLLTFLPYFEDEEAEKFTVSDIAVPGPYLYKDQVQEFVRVLNEEDFVTDFDWPNWGPQAVEYFKERERIETADLETLQKLFTTIVRAEKMTSGVLAEMIDKGIITDLLRRLSKLQSEKGNEA